MKIAVSGKGGVGKTTITAWLGDYLARMGHQVWLVDADTALSLGQASGLDAEAMPVALAQRAELVRERIRPAGQGGMMVLNPHVEDLPEILSAELPVAGPSLGQWPVGRKRLLVMGALTTANGGCACEANALLKAMLAHLVLARNDWVLVDMEAGVEHLGRGTVAHVDRLLVVSEPSLRSLQTAVQVSRMAADMGLHKQSLVLNRTVGAELCIIPPELQLPDHRTALPLVPQLRHRQLLTTNVFGLDGTDQKMLDRFFRCLLEQWNQDCYAEKACA
ncbi:P-loop NTPase [Desulfovibrio sp.]|uniref:ATP-binding protein n=1 Tax=Desulfovibrio sp. TaxID=885 RepID=UPI0025C44DEC|nr:P-loop NTPase [Desulfovibrio sp.]